MQLYFGAGSVIILQLHGEQLHNYSCSAERGQMHELSHAFYDLLAGSQQHGFAIPSELVLTVLFSKLTTLDYVKLL